VAEVFSAIFCFADNRNSFISIGAIFEASADLYAKRAPLMRHVARPEMAIWKC
jgi:hypothetical protein